jgi:eukaryotic-like serine/threonine-protein kinase
MMLAGAGKNLASTRGRLFLAAARDRKQAHEAGTIRALCLVNTEIGLADNLSQGIEECAKTLALYEVPGQSGQEHPDWACFDPAERLRLAEDQRELYLLLSHSRVRRANGEPGVVRESLGLLKRAEAVAGLPPSRALWEERARYFSLLGDHEHAANARLRAARTPASTARDHYLLATSYARRGTREALTRAVSELDQALGSNAHDYWSSMQRGICQMELGNLVAATGDFGRCIGLWPEFSWGYLNRGCALDRSGKKSEAVADYSDAILRDPTLLPAYVNRGLALLELKRYADALADFEMATTPDRHDPSIEAGRGMALEGLGRGQEADAAFQSALAHAATLDEAVRTRLFWTYGFAVAGRLPDKAGNAFETVLLSHPTQPQALYGCAMIAMGRDHRAQALGYFNRALEAKPDFSEARQYRAILLARLGQWARAREEINRCLERDADSGMALYAAACVASLASKALADPAAADQAVMFLEKARAHGTDVNKAATDPDLEPLRAHPGLKRLLTTPSKPQVPEC